MSRRIGCWRRLVLAWALAACAAGAGEPAKEGPKEPPTQKVERGPFTVEVELKGVFEARDRVEVALYPEEWASFTVLRAVDQGTPVKKGDLVLALDTAKIDQAIEETQAALGRLEVAIGLARQELSATEKLEPLDLDAAKRAKSNADEDLARYVEIDRPLSVRQASFSVKTRADFLAYEEEELRQLEKMYKADELTEETEEIVLRRQRDAVERAKFALETAKVAADRTLKIELPRQDVGLKENVLRQDIALAKAAAALPMALQKARLDLDKQADELAKAREKLAKLKKDREAMTVKAPVDGVVYYGPCVRGNWPKLSQTLERGSSVPPNAPILSIVQPRPLLIRAEVPEKDLEQVRPGAAGKAAPVGYPSLSLKAQVETVSPVPVSAGAFDSKIAVTLVREAEPLMPGMTCTVKLVAYTKKDAIAIPASALLTEGDESFVNVAGKDGRPERRPVTVGKRTSDKAEILQGLKAGDEVFLEKPKGGK